MEGGTSQVFCVLSWTSEQHKLIISLTNTWALPPITLHVPQLCAWVGCVGPPQLGSLPSFVWMAVVIWTVPVGHLVQVSLAGLKHVATATRHSLLHIVYMHQWVIWSWFWKLRDNMYVVLLTMYMSLCLSSRTYESAGLVCINALPTWSMILGQPTYPSITCTCM